MTDRTTPPQSLTASAAARPGVRYDFRGVVIGPWSDSVKRTNALLNKTRRVPLPEQFRR